ncbi:hypothetical protein Q4489_03555 [Thalassotalea sp. 1_MG-2023]|uniref:WD40 repeat domain-containing protein n=1 Tax=Thalassotalea sp. 1_MG-2023 TaxID=3062680 RepID=UPI0026E1931C|nr:hypothetical protein [Thalassotalea sp. 1_MG-2023]MDO6426071.1 hypothetical protein [Thalassotalea sp. 1_MG-2023]
MRKFLILLFCLTLNACTDQPVYTSAAMVTQHYSEAVLKAADISSDGTLSILSDNEQVCIWDNIKNQQNYCLQGLDAKLIELVGISHTKRYFYTSNRVNVHLYNLATGRLIRVWSAGDNIINDIAMTNNENTLIFAFRSGQASVVSVHSDVINTFKLHRLDINTVAASDDGTKALTGSSDKRANLWSIQTGELLESYHHQSRVNHVALSPTGKIAFTLDAIKDRYFWRTGNTQPQAELGSHVKFIEFNDSQIINHNKWLLSASPKQVIQLWRVSDGELIAQWQAYKHEQRFRSSVLAIEMINPNTIASITSDGVYQQWSVSITTLD